MFRQVSQLAQAQSVSPSQKRRTHDPTSSRDFGQVLPGRVTAPRIFPEASSQSIARRPVHHRHRRMAPAVFSDVLTAAYSPLTAHANIDYIALLALICGGLFGYIASVFIVGGECCGCRIVVIWRSCCEVRFLRRVLTRAPAARPPPPTMSNNPFMSQQQQRRPLIAPIARRSHEPPIREDAAAWNRLRDALGPDVPDLEVASLLETHGDDLEAAVQAYFDAQSSRRHGARR